jgi:flagellar protein FliO/FliZ
MAPSDYLRFLAALVFVLGLIGLLAWLARRTRLAGQSGGPGGGRRLALVEMLPLDARHRLALVRRDGVEHLLLLAQGANHVVEAGIVAVAPTSSSAPGPQATEAEPDAATPAVRAAGPGQRGTP